ncbi:MAG: DoxX family protein [Acidimicrobiaceae bacterium]|nr:DoxX family protein [Acidimicrobiaceae bacterium]
MVFGTAVGSAADTRRIPTIRGGPALESTTDLDLALLVLRAVAGLTLAAHGWNKFFGGGRIPGTGRWFDSIGMRPGRLNAVLAASSEVGAGVLLALGLFNPFAAAGVIGVMVVAGWTVHRANGFFIIKEGWEYVAVLAVMALVSATLGPGAWSLDEALGIADDLSGWTGFWIALLLGVGGGVAQMLVFFRPSKVASGD